MSDVGTGRVAIVLEGYSGLAGGLNSHLIDGIAVASLERLDDFKDLPTVAETLPGFVAGGWNVLLAPVGTPDAIIQKASKDLNKAMEDAELKKKLAALGAYPHPMTPARGHRLRPGPAAHLAADRGKGRTQEMESEVRPRRRALVCIGARCLAGAARRAAPAAAETFPDRPIKVIAPFTPGSPNDVVARLIAHADVGAARAIGGGREQAGRRHRDRRQGDDDSGAGRLYPDDLQQPDAFHHAAGQQDLHLRSAEGLRADRIGGERRADAGDRARGAGERRCRNSSPMPGPIRASSTSASARAPCRNWSARCSSSRPAPTSPTSPTRAASRRSPTCWAAGCR